MLKQRNKSASRSSSKGRKHRTGAYYSKEDIRDQYCINQKELQAFEEFSKNRLFGCLSTGNLLNLNFTPSNLAHQTTSYLPNGQRVQSKDRTIARYADISDRDVTDSETSSDYGCRNTLSFLSCMRKPVRMPKHYQRPLDPKFWQQQSDDDFGFKRLPIRPPRTCTVKANPSKTASSISVIMTEQQIPQQQQQTFPSSAYPLPPPHPIHQTSFQPNAMSLADYQGILRQNTNFIDNLQNQLNNFVTNKAYASTSKSADELNDLDGDPQANNKTKHVSFELVRSNTISANLAQQVFNMQQTNQMNGQISNQLNERLINAEVAQLPVKAGLITSSNLPAYPFQTSLNQINQLNPYISLVPNYASIVQLQKQPPTQQPSSTSADLQPQTTAQLAHHLIAQQQQPIPPQPPIRSMHKKVIMKTQSTQTENSIFFSTHQSRSRSSSRSRFRDQQNLLNESILIDDDAYLVGESLEPSECEYSSAAMAVDQQQHSINKARRSSMELPAYLTLSPRSSSKHRSKRKHAKDPTGNKRTGKQHQLLLNYQKLQNQLIDDSDDQLDELSLLSKLSQLDRDQRALKSGHYGYKSSSSSHHHHATPVANLTKSLIQNVKLSQQHQQQYAAEANKHVHKNRPKLYRKSLGDVDLGLLSFEHDLSEPILSVRELNELNQANTILNHQLRQLNKTKSADLLDEDLIRADTLVSDAKSVNRILESDKKYETKFDEKLSLNLSPPEAFQDRVLSDVDRTKDKIVEQEPIGKETSQIVNELEQSDEERKQTITKESDTNDENQLPIQAMSDDQERTSTTPNEESSIKQTTVIDQYSKSPLSEKCSTSLTEEGFKATESDAIQKTTSIGQSVAPDALKVEEEILEKELDKVCLEKENELIKQLSDELESPIKFLPNQLTANRIGEEAEIEDDEQRTMKPETTEDELATQRNVQKEVSIESLLTRQLADRTANELDNEVVKCKLIEKSDLEEVSDEDELDDEDDLMKVVDLTGGVYLRRQIDQSSELSTVSEVSEEVSLDLNDETYSVKQKSKASNLSNISNASSSSKHRRSADKPISDKEPVGEKEEESVKMKSRSKSGSSSDTSIPSMRSESSSTTSNDVNVEELNDEDDSKKVDKSKSKSASSSKTSSANASLDNLPTLERRPLEDGANDLEKRDELSLSKSLSQELSDELNRKLEDLQLESYEQEPKMLANLVQQQQQRQSPSPPKPPQSNLAQLKRCLDSEEFDPKIYRAFSVSVEEPFNLENVDQADKKESDENQTIEDSESNFSTIFGQTLEKEVSLSEKSCNSKSSKSSKGSKSSSKASSSSAASSGKSSSKSQKSIKLSTSESTSTSSSKTSSSKSGSSSKKKTKSRTSPTTSTNEYKLLSVDSEESTMDNCSKCAAELAAALQKPIALDFKQPTPDLKQPPDIKPQPEVNNLLKAKPNTIVSLNRTGLNVEQPMVEGASNDALAVLNQNLETAGESSQATEQDVANFSFGQQSSQDLADEDSLCLIQSIHATGSSSVTTDNNKLSSTTRSSHSLQNQKLISGSKKASIQQASSASMILEKKRQLESAFTTNQSTSSSSLKNGGHQLQPLNEQLLKTIESEECLNKDDDDDEVNAEENNTVFDESSSISLLETAGKSRVRNLLQRFENRPVSFAGEPIELGRKERRRSSQSSGRVTIFAKQFGPKSQSIDLICDDSLIGTNVSSSLKHSASLDHQPSTDEQCMEQPSLDDEQSPEVPLRKSSSSSRKSSRKSSRSGSSGGSAKSDQLTNKEKAIILIKKKSIEEYDESSQQKSIGDESISELISEVSSSVTDNLKDEQQPEDVIKANEEESLKKDYSVSLSSKASSSRSSTSTTKTGTTKESSEKKMATTDLHDQQQPEAKALSDEHVVNDIIKRTDDTRIEQEREQIDKKQQDAATSSNITSSTTTTTASSDYSDLKIKLKEHDTALRQKQQLLQQQHSIKRKLLTQLSTSGLAALEKQQQQQQTSDEQTEKTVEKSRISSSQDDVLSISGEDEDQLTVDKVTLTNRESESDAKLHKRKSIDDTLSSGKDEEASKTEGSRKDKKSTITNLPIYPTPGKLSSTKGWCYTHTYNANYKQLLIYLYSHLLHLTLVNVSLIIDELDEDIGIHSAPYTSGSWFYVTHEDEWQGKLYGLITYFPIDDIHYINFHFVVHFKFSLG